MKKSRILMGLLCIGVILGAVAVFALSKVYRPEGMRKDFARLKTEEYHGVFVSSFSTQEYDEEFFAVYRGVPTVIGEFSMRRLEDYADYFNVIWDSGNTITNIYLGIDPYEIWLEANKKEEKWNALMDDMLIRYILAHPNVEFEIVLPYHSLESWKQESLEEKLQVYYSFIDRMDDYANVIQYFLGGEEWLIANPENYTERGITPELARHISLMTFCDRKYVIGPGNAEIILGRLENLLKSGAAKDYPDYSDYSFVYFGDSIIASAHGSYSIPGIVEGLTGAAGYNMAVGGSSAAMGRDGYYFITNIAKAFLERDTGFGIGSDFATGLQEYMEEGADGKKQVILLNYGLNDYFSGKLIDNPDDPFDETTYGGALRSGIKLLQEGLPEADILLMTPTYTTEFASGTEDVSGYGYMLTDYVETAVTVGEEMDVAVMNNYQALGIGSDNQAEYLVDGCHPNDDGRFLLANAIIETLKIIILGE